MRSMRKIFQMREIFQKKGSSWCRWGRLKKTMIFPVWEPSSGNLPRWLKQTMIFPVWEPPKVTELDHDFPNFTIKMWELPKGDWNRPWFVQFYHDFFQFYNLNVGTSQGRLKQTMIFPVWEPSSGNLPRWLKHTMIFPVWEPPKVTELDHDFPNFTIKMWELPKGDWNRPWFVQFYHDFFQFYNLNVGTSQGSLKQTMIFPILQLKCRNLLTVTETDHDFPIFTV